MRRFYRHISSTFSKIRTIDGNELLRVSETRRVKMIVFEFKEKHNHENW